jgi:DNA processing protein
MDYKKYEIKKHGKYYYRGEWDDSLFKNSIAIVGSRQMTRYGEAVVDKFVSDFVLNNVITVSGFMYGVDTEVAKKTVEYGGKHIAVFGCGLNVIYPAENEKVYGQILENGGLVVSEYEPNAKPHLWKFPQRNKVVISLSSLGVLVIEAGHGSGSLVTAKLAIKAKKKVFAVPGPIISKVSVGCNDLIKNGDAKLVTSVSDIIHTKLKIKNEKLKIEYKSNTLEQKICGMIQNDPMEIDQIARKMELSIEEISTTLSIMGIKGLVTESGGKYYPVV